MKNYKKILGVTLATLVVMLASGCTEKFDTPAPYKAVDEEYITKEKNCKIISIASLKQRYFEKYGDNLDPAKNIIVIDDDIAIRGTVISTDWHGNVYRSLYIQDETGAMEIKVGQTGMFARYPVGTEIFVICKGLHLGSYRHNLSLGAASTNPKYSNGFIDLKVDVNNTILVGEPDQPIDTLVINAANVNELLGATEAQAKQYSIIYDVFDKTTGQWKEEDRTMNFYRYYNNNLVRFEDMESWWGIPDPADNADDRYNYGSRAEDKHPQFLSNYNNSAFGEQYGTYNNYVFLDVINQWAKYDDGGRVGTMPITPRPGVEGIQDFNKPFLRYPTWGFKSATMIDYKIVEVGYFASSLWRVDNRYFTIRTSGFADFALKKLPEHGTMIEATGIMTRYSGKDGTSYKKIQIALNSFDDIKIVK